VGSGREVILPARHQDGQDTLRLFRLRDNHISEEQLRRRTVRYKQAPDRAVRRALSNRISHWFATPLRHIWVAPYGSIDKQSSTLLHLVKMTMCIAPRRAVRLAASWLAESIKILPRATSNPSSLGNQRRSQHGYRRYRARAPRLPSNAIGRDALVHQTTP
jgi:hypothetical protein